MRAINHVVLCGHDLEAMRASYSSLGFTLAPPGVHPFGTRNSVVQFDHPYLELLTVADPALVPEHTEEEFSFAAFNRDFLAEGEGFSMLALDSADARADAARFREKGLQTFKPFDFARMARLPSGEEARVGFSLAFVCHPDMPRAGFFCCQPHAPQYFHVPAYQNHINTAFKLLEATLVAEKPEELTKFLEFFAGVKARLHGDGLVLPLASQKLSVVTPLSFEKQYRTDPPDLSRGPRFGGLTIDVRKLETFRSYLTPAEQAGSAATALRFGTAITAVAHVPPDR